MATPAPATPSPIDVAFPPLDRYADGNSGVPYVWRYEASRAGPNVVVQALTHGNEVCGAIALDWLLQHDFRPTRGTFTGVFANVAAYRAFDRGEPFASRCIDEDFNRLWTSDVLGGSRQSAELARARELRPVYDAAHFLLDLHSMTDKCPPLALCGRQRKGFELARAVGVPETIVIDAGHAAGRRLRDYAFFDEADDPRNALLIECGQHWERTAPLVALQATLRFLRHLDVADDAFVDEHLDPVDPPPQRAIEVTESVTIGTDSFAFALPVVGLTVIPARGTLLARDGSREIVTPYDDCVLIMPTRRPKRGETAVRLGRVVALDAVR